MQRHALIAPVFHPRRASIPAAYVPDRSMQTNQPLGTRALMQSINVLGDEREVRPLPCPAREHVMRGVRLRLDDQSAAPVVPLPYQCRVVLEGFGRCESFRAESLPE